MNKFATNFSLVISVFLFSGCVTRVNTSTLEQRTSFALGLETSEFNIIDQRDDGRGRIDYSVNTNDNKFYKCYVHGTDVLTEVLSFGQVSMVSDAVCNEFGKKTELKKQGVTPGCNAQLRAAGRC